MRTGTSHDASGMLAVGSLLTCLHILTRIESVTVDVAVFGYVDTPSKIRLFTDRVCKSVLRE